MNKTSVRVTWAVRAAVAMVFAGLLLGSAAVPFAAAQDTPSGKKDQGKKGDQRKGKEGREDEQPAASPLPPYFGPKKRLAVADLEVKVTATSATTATPSGASTTTSLNVDVPPPSDFGTGMTEMLTTALIDSNRFVLLERKNLKDIQDEQALQKTDAVDQTSAVKPGSLLGAQAIIRGAITEYAYKKSAANSGGILGKVLDVTKNTAEASVVLDIRIYDAATGVIIDSVKAEGKAKATGSAFNIGKGDFKVNGGAFNSTPLGHATREAIENAVKFIAQRMEAKPWEGAVADVETEGDKVTSIYLSAGTKEGLKVGDEFEVLKPGKTIVHPQTRVVLGRGQDKLLGRCKITSIMKDFAIAVPTDGAGFEKENVVRLVGSGGEVKKQ